MNWKGLVVGLLAIAVSVITYLLTRRRELAWKRTEFLSEQAKYLEDDPVLTEVITILEERHPTIKVQDIFGNGGTLDEVKRAEYVQKFDKFLGFLWRLSYAHLTLKTISSAEVEAFGWYYWRIAQMPTLVDYCENFGFGDINLVTKKLRLDEEE